MTSDYPQDPYEGQPYYGQQPPPGYTPPGYTPPGYTPPGYYPHPGHPFGPPGYGYPPPYYPQQLQRPGTATASCVLAFVNGGLLIAAALLLFAGASVISDFSSSSQYDSAFTSAQFTTTEFRLDALINLLAAVLLIGGGVALAGRKPTGRTSIVLGSVLVIASTIYWLARFDAFATTVFYGLLFAALSVLSVAMAYTAATKQWLVASPATPPPPYPTY